MNDLKKINIAQLYYFWRNLSIVLLLLILMQLLEQIVPPFFSIMFGLLSAGIIYVLIYTNKTSHHPTYMIVGYGLMAGFLSYTLANLLINLFKIWDLFDLPEEIISFTTPYFSSLLLLPICCISLIIVYLRRRSVSRHLNEKFNIDNFNFQKGKLGVILTAESRRQMLNLIYLLAFLSIVCWAYFSYFYINVGQPNNRDKYIFIWFGVICFILYEIQLTIHYFTLTAELKFNDELITPEELADIADKWYLRCYVICNNKMLLSKKCFDPNNVLDSVADTPFFTLYSSGFISEADVKKYMDNELNVTEGELRYFYGQKMPGMDTHKILRYFYFLNGNPEDYPELDKLGDWVTMEQLYGYYRKNPKLCSPLLTQDCSRLLTIVMTQKMFDEEGNRRFKIKNYRPSFSFDDVRRSDLNFQSDKWIKVYAFNAENTTFFKVRKWWRKIINGANVEYKDKGHDE